MDQGYSLQRNVLTKELVNEAKSIYSKSNHRFKQTISGHYEQLDILKPKVANPELTQDFRHKLMKSLTDRLSTLIPEAKSWECFQLKYLTADPGSSEQMPHRDSDEHEFVVCAIYLTKNFSTDMSVHPYPNVDMKAMTPKEKSAHWPLPWPSKSDDFVSYPVEAGDVMFFRPDILHRGIKNQSDETRLVLFCVLGPKEKTTFDDDFSIFEFIFAEQLHGRGSKEHLEALSRCHQYKPINHYPSQRTKNMLKRKLTAFERSQKRQKVRQ